MPSSELFDNTIFQISFEDPLNTKPIIELPIYSKKHVMQFLKSFLVSTGLEFVKTWF